MSINVDLEKIINTINVKEGLLFKPSSHPTESSESYIACFSGEYLSFGEIIIAFKSSFPYTIPDIFIKDTSVPHLHVLSNGKVCITEESSLLIDVDNPEQIIMECLYQVAKILSIEQNTDMYSIELKKEFLSYWGIYTEGIIYFSILQVPKNKTFFEYPLFKCNSKYRRIVLMANSLNDAGRYIYETLGYDKSNMRVEPFGNALVIRLKQGYVLPSPFQQNSWLYYICYIRDNTDADTYKQFLKYTDKRVKKQTLTIVFVAPYDDGDILFGIVTVFNNKNAVRMRGSSNVYIKHLNIRREDRGYLLARGGAIPSLHNKRVLLLGCGSIGSYVANNLCQLGITQIDLLDKDEFKTENIYRHFMGYEAIRKSGSKYKANLLHKILVDKYPDIDIDPLDYQERTVEAIILDHPERLLHYDLVISALGEPTINLALNKLLVVNDIHTPFIVCFNEPYGIGGHVITINLSREFCLQCFYTDVVEGTIQPFRGSLVAPDQNFKKSLSGCSSTFVPFSTLDSQQTAIYTARKAVDVLSGQLKQNDFFTWRGNSYLIESKGYKVSKLYNSQKLDCIIANPKCLVCKGGK